MSFSRPLSQAVRTGISYAAMGMKELHNTFLMGERRPFIGPFQGQIVWMAEVNGRIAHGFSLRSMPPGHEFVRLHAGLKTGRITQHSLFHMESYSEYRN